MQASPLCARTRAWCALAAVGCPLNSARCRSGASDAWCSCWPWMSIRSVRVRPAQAWLAARPRRKSRQTLRPEAAELPRNGEQAVLAVDSAVSAGGPPGHAGVSRDTSNSACTDALFRTRCGSISRSRRAPPTHEAQAVDHDGFTGAGFACKHVEALRQLDGAADSIRAMFANGQFPAARFASLSS